jgi:2-C-methyl-D-erythritol 4-phosphate cytidylyltransferase
VVAGGSGNRFGGLKQFAEIDGQSVAERSIRLCRSVADSVTLVVPKGMATISHGADVVVEGGASRSMSVRAGLATIGDDVEVVVVHDAARPLASEHLFRSVVDELSDPEVDGAIPGLPMVDTVKATEIRDGAVRVAETLDRSSLVLVQTPQAFRAEALRAAHSADDDATDDAALVEARGGVVIVVAGEEQNIKITSKADLALAEWILEDRS